MTAMNISKDDAERLQELHAEIDERVTEFKQICRSAMSSGEYQRFKYNCLGHLEPGLSEDNGWAGHHLTLEKVVERALDDAKEEEDEEEEEETDENH